MRRVFSVLLGAQVLSLAQATIHPADPSKNISWPYHSFKTVDFTPPVVNTTHRERPSEGLLFFAPDGATDFQLGPLITSTGGSLIWNGPHEHAFNFGVQQYKGEPVLVFWNGSIFPEPFGRGNGVVYMYNQKYELMSTTTLAGNFLEQVPGATYPSNIDLHEIYLTERGTMLVTANNVTTADLTSVGGPKDGWVVEAFIYEIDVATDRVLFEWKSLDHQEQLSFSSSHYPLGSEGFDGTSQATAWGYFHVNAVAPYGDGYIISSRYLCSAIAIDKTGEVLWRLDGRTGGDFVLKGDNTNFCYQHDIRVVESRSNGVTIRMHDNHNAPIENGTVPSSAKIIDINFETKEATLQQRLLNQTGLVYSTAQGNYQLLSDGNIFVGHGWIPVLEEFSTSGHVVSTIQFGAAEAKPGGGYLSNHAPTLSYRAFKQEWTGCPIAPPDVVAEKGAKGVDVYVSWNGATDVEKWAVYAGNSKQSLKHVKTVKKHGFETRGEIDQAKYVQIRPRLTNGSKCKNVDSAIVSIG